MNVTRNAMVNQLRQVNSSVTESAFVPTAQSTFQNVNVATHRSAKVASRNVLVRRNGNPGVRAMANAAQDTGSASGMIIALLTHSEIRLHPNRKPSIAARKRFASRASGASGPKAMRRNATRTVKYSVNDLVNVPKALQKMTRSAAAAKLRNVSLARVPRVRVWVSGLNGDRATDRAEAESRSESGTMNVFPTLSRK